MCRKSGLVIYQMCFQEELNEYLEVGYILLRWQLLSAPYRSNISSRDLTGAHNKLLILILLTRHLDVLSPSQVVFSLFLAGVSREYPNLPYESTRTQGFPIPDPLIAKLGKSQISTFFLTLFFYLNFYFTIWIK